MNLAELRRMAEAVAEIARDKATAEADTGRQMTTPEVAEWVGDFTNSEDIA